MRKYLLLFWPLNCTPRQKHTKPGIAVKIPTIHSYADSVMSGLKSWTCAFPTCTPQFVDFTTVLGEKIAGFVPYAFFAHPASKWNVALRIYFDENVTFFFSLTIVTVSDSRR